jgi:hypothetical protein
MHPIRANRVFVALTAGLLLVAGTSFGVEAGGQTPTTSDQHCGPDDPLPEFFGGIFAVKAVVSTPGQPERELSDRQATAYLQTWLPYSIFASPPQEPPPGDLPVSRIVVTQRDENGEAPLDLLFATDGTNAWVGAPNAVPPPPEKWIRAPRPEQTIAAFNGELEPFCINQPVGETTTSATTAGPTSTTAGATSTSAGATPRTTADSACWRSSSSRSARQQSARASSRRYAAAGAERTPLRSGRCSTIRNSIGP